MFRVLRPGGILFVADWGKPHGPGMRAAFFGLQLQDGFANTADHVRGLVPRYIADAGFTGVERIDRLRTVVGTFEILRADRPWASAGPVVSIPQEGLVDDRGLPGDACRSFHAVLVAAEESARLRTTALGRRPFDRLDT